MSYLDNPGNRLVRQTVRLGKHDRSGDFVTHRNIELFQQAEAVARIEGVRNLARMLRAAEESRVHADSWRGFAVGGSAFVMYFNEDAQSWRYELVHGANAKPTEDSAINVHAEHTLMTKAVEFARPGETVSIPFMCIIGDLQPDQQTGVRSSTLHPCGVCREVFKQPDTPVCPTTMFVSATADMCHFEWYSAGGLDTFHATGDTAGMGGYDFTEPPLAPTFDPASIIQNGVARMDLLEDDVFVQSDREIAMHLIVPMLQLADSLNAGQF